MARAAVWFILLLPAAIVVTSLLALVRVAIHAKPSERVSLIIWWAVINAIAAVAELYWFLVFAMGLSHLDWDVSGPSPSWWIGSAVTIGLHAVLVWRVLRANRADESQGHATDL